MPELTPRRRDYLRRYNRARQRALVALARRHRREYLALVAAERTRPEVDEPAGSETV
jgi:hypothetical protein